MTEIVQAIREAEAKTSGEIRVFIQRGKLNVDPLIVAQKKFHQLGMHKTRERNAVLDFRSAARAQVRRCWRQGDSRKMRRTSSGNALWTGCASHFQNEKFSDALIGSD